MPLLCFNSLTFTPLSSPLPASSSSSILAIAATPVCRLHLKPADLPPKSLSGVRTSFVVKKTCSLVVRAAAAADAGSSSDDGSTSGNEGKKEVVVPVDKLPLESKAKENEQKLKEREEQRLRMKIARKIRLKRKRLVRKRKLRKKGRWPPSKMKKLKNV